MRASILLIAPAALLLGGCLSTAANIITAPVRAVGQVVDWTTTSQSEADRNLGRRVREREAQIGRLERDRARQARRCEGGDAGACTRAEQLAAEIAELRDWPVR